MALTMKHLFFIRWLASKSAIRSVKLIALAVGVLTANFVYSAYVFCTLKKSRRKKGEQKREQNCGPHKTTCRAKSDAIDEIISRRDSPSESEFH